MSRIDDIAQFYELLDLLEERVGGKRTFADLTAFRELSRRGVYFFFEPGESRSESGNGPRVSRIGTHALTSGSQSTLRKRLKQHAGGRNSGNHRGSIFRLLTGRAMLTRGDIDPCPSWGVKNDVSSAAHVLGVDRASIMVAEHPVELAVSAYLQTMPFICLDIGDEPGPKSLRGIIERNAIALLSNYERPSLDASSDNWLGHASDRPLVRGSGMWNQHHVNETHESDFLDVLATLIAEQTRQAR